MMDAKEFFEDGFPFLECDGCEWFEGYFMCGVQVQDCHIADVSQCPAYLKSLDGGE
jgi:hypothetical protein